MPDEKNKDQQRREAERATEESQRQAEKEQRERERKGDAPPEDDDSTKEAPDKAPEPAEYAPIEPDDDEKNPVYVEVPKTDEEVAEEGTALAEAGSAQTGGAVPFLSTEPATNTRIWSMDAAHNTNDRGGGRGAEHPDLVETTQ